MATPLSLMIINANAAEREVVKRTLGRLDVFEVIEQSDSQQALQLLKERPVSLVITGLDVGKIDGWRFSRMVRSGLLKTPKHTPIVLTPPFYCERIAETTARSYGIDAVVPIERQDLLPQALAKVLSTQLEKSSRLKLLLLEPDAAKAQQMSDALALNFAVQVCDSATHTLDIYLQGHYAIVLLDASVANTASANTLVQNILAHNPSQAIVTIIDSQDADYAEQLLLSGVTDFVRRPYDNALLMKVCDHAARREDFIASYGEFEKKVAQLSQSQQKYKELYSAHQRILMHLNTVVMELDEHGRISFLNPAWEANTGFGLKHSIGTRLEDYCYEGHKPRLKTALNAVFKAQAKRRKIELQLQASNGQLIWFECRFQHVSDHNHSAVITASIDNIEERKQAELKLQHLALHDTLTGLHNRYYFDLQLSALCQATAGDDLHALIYIDLDHFKIINDSKGHQEGDTVLKEVAELFLQHIEEQYLIFRIGGDEFAILLPNTPLLDAHMVAESICVAIDGHQFQCQEQIYSISCSIGVTQISVQNNDANECLKQADIALYIAKSQGRNLVHCYDASDSHSNAMQSGLEWGHNVRSALQQDNIELHYQPVWDIKRSRIAYYEVLLRLRIDGELIYPNHFIPALEMLNDSYLMDQCVVRSAIRDLSEHPEIQRVAINLSAQSLLDDRLLPHIKTMLYDHGVDPKRVIFEITESASVGNLEATREMILALNALGCDFSIDDFGTGFSTFDYLKRLPAQHVKIDGSFVRDMQRDPIDYALVKAINDIAASLDKGSVAEYVENKEIYGMLKEIGVDYAQGYFIAKPAPLHALENNQKIIAAKTSG
ncbi:EAL domain-containing protein [Pseudoalteromonas sp. BDTF-M6]|uniref:two-component system response regulator n=1 Tax=Pseudoalteromonas sp. BDTF-M6 TaxID=2796132 RepID=UPI001BAF6513|nr:EAL domain-containing protein [Pseudoalteromonas sp. BDTF-M6]MBS3797383.1 EAL domain-containing protein [Pseudoalteromonas sp. BDTF-M6]